MTVEEMKQFRELIEENCELKNELAWQKREYIKHKAVAEIVEKYGLVTHSDGIVQVVMGVIEGDDAMKLIEILSMKEV